MFAISFFSILVYEQELYEREGIAYPSALALRDINKTVDLLLQRPIGIFNILKDECKLATDESHALLRAKS